MKPKSTLLSFLLAAGSSLLAISSATAQSWSGGTNSEWLNTTNWVGFVAAAGSTTSTDTDIAVFNNGTQTTVGIGMSITSGVFYLGAIDRTTNNAARFITNSSSTNGILTLNGATVNEVANTILRNTTTGLVTIQNGTSGNGTLGLALGNATANVIQITGNGGITIRSDISGSGGITRQGAGNGALTLAGNNSYTGITASNGVINLSSNNGLGSTDDGSHTTITANGSTTGGRVLLGNTVSTPENITVGGMTETTGFNPALGTSTGTGTFSGTITLAGSGGIRLGGVASTTNFTGTITQTGTNYPLAFIGTNNVSNAMTINGAAVYFYNGTTTLSGASGSGIGDATINQSGALTLGITNALNTSANLAVGINGSTVNSFDLAGFDQTVNALTAAGANANSNRRVVNTVAGTSILTVGNGGGSGTFNGQIDSGIGDIQLIKTGSGNQTLNDQNSYTGGTRIDGGTLTLGHAAYTLASTGAVNVNGGELALGTNTNTVGAVTLTSGSISGTGEGRLTGTSYAVESGTISAKLGGSGAMTKTTAGTVTISSENSGGGGYTGAVAVNAGTLIVDGNISTSITTVESGATIGGSGTTGALTVQSGGFIKPGNSPGIISTGDYTQSGLYTAEI